MRYFSLEKLINLHDGYRKTFKIDQHNLLLVQEEGERYLIESYCPHRGQPLVEAAIHGTQVTCPRHGYCFDLRSGDLLHRTEEPCHDLHCYDLVEEGREVGVLL